MPSPSIPSTRPAPHPGELLKTHLPKNLSLLDAARRLGVSRQTLSAIINGRASVSARMALRLEAALDVSADYWLTAQTRYDLYRARQRPPRGVKPIG